MTAPTHEEMCNALREAIALVKMQPTHDWIDRVRALRAALAELEAQRWRPIEEAEPNTPALLYAPPERIYATPLGRKGEYRACSPASYTWATHWRPLPEPPSNG